MFEILKRKKIVSNRPTHAQNFKKQEIKDHFFLAQSNCLTQIMTIHNQIRPHPQIWLQKWKNENLIFAIVLSKLMHIYKVYF
jgi:hypothetical protein